MKAEELSALVDRLSAAASGAAFSCECCGSGVGSEFDSEAQKTLLDLERATVEACAKLFCGWCSINLPESCATGAWHHRDGEAWRKVWIRDSLGKLQALEDVRK